MELSEIIPHIEALIFASDRPLTSLDLVDLINNAFGFMEQQITLDQVETALEGIREKYSSDFYPFEVFQSGGGWQFLSKPAFHTTIAQLNGGKFLKKLSNAALETLSIIAYKQPITKGEIESIRGVNSDYSVQKLLEKELIIISGRNEEMPGKPLIYETSKSFMDYFGLNTASDLPKIKEVLAEQIEPTLQQRNVEENADFGIFSKFDQQQAPDDQTDTRPFIPGESSTDDNDEILELELSDEQNRESTQEASTDMEHALHPDLSDIKANITQTAISEDEAAEHTEEDKEQDSQEDELADLEAHEGLTASEEGEDEKEEDEDDDDDDDEDDDDEDDDDEDDDDDDEDDDEGDDDDDDDDEDDDDEDEDEDEGDEDDEDEDEDDEEDEDVDEDEDEEDDEEEEDGRHSNS